jgi:hypothetical protein
VQVAAVAWGRLAVVHVPLAMVMAERVYVMVHTPLAFLDNPYLFYSMYFYCYVCFYF